MIKFTVFGDLHFDEVDDGNKRVNELVEHIKSVKPDFVISLGDLCKPVSENKEIVLDKFMATGIPMYHTIGNHETDACYLDEEERMQGVAKQLLNACQNYAKEQGCKEFASDCELDNESSLRFHLKMGFAETNRIICFTKKL